MAGGPQQGPDQPGGGGLAVRPRDPRQGEVPAGMGGEGRAQFGIRPPHIGDDALRHMHARLGPVGQQGGGTARQGIGDVSGTILAAAADDGEDRGRLTEVAAIGGVGREDSCSPHEAGVGKQPAQIDGDLAVRQVEAAKRGVGNHGKAGQPGSSGENQRCDGGRPCSVTAHAVRFPAHAEGSAVGVLSKQQMGRIWEPREEVGREGGESRGSAIRGFGAAGSAAVEVAGILLIYRKPSITVLTFFPRICKAYKGFPVSRPLPVAE